jgi:hypothetical protein
MLAAAPAKQNTYAEFPVHFSSIVVGRFGAAEYPRSFHLAEAESESGANSSQDGPRAIVQKLVLYAALAAFAVDRAVLPLI